MQFFWTKVLDKSFCFWQKFCEKYQEVICESIVHDFKIFLGHDKKLKKLNK